MADRASAIIYKENDLWYAQEQGVCGRQTIGGFPTRKGVIAACAREWGDEVELSYSDDEDAEVI